MIDKYWAGFTLPVLARKLRMQYAGAMYQVMNRGDRLEPIFRDEADREGCVAALAEAYLRSGWQVQAYCLMPNHFHLVVETPQPTLMAGMKWLLGTYTGRFNRRHKVFGHLFSDRYKALIVEGSGNGYLGTVCDYVRLNPVRAKLLAAEQPLSAYPWSSFPAYLLAPSKRPAWLRVDRVLRRCRFSLLTVEARLVPKSEWERSITGRNGGRARWSGRKGSCGANCARRGGRRSDWARPRRGIR